MTDGRRSLKNNLTEDDSTLDITPNTPTPTLEPTSSITDELRNLIKPLATNDRIDLVLNKIEEITARFEEKIKKQDERICTLESSLSLRQNTVDVLLEQLSIKADETEQYSRRSCVRITGIEDNDKDVEDLVVECFNKVNINVNKDDIERAHRIGVSYVDDISKLKVKPIIVKFHSWKKRTQFYQARPRAFVNGVKKSEPLPFRVALDLTKIRLDLLKCARSLILNNPNFLYVYSNINCKLVIKDVNNKLHHFNTKGQLDKIIASV